MTTTTANERPKVWTIGVQAWQALEGVHQPWICEISPMQFAHMSKRAKAQYEEKRHREWQASSDCKTRYREAVVAAFDRGEFTLETPDVHPDASERVFWALRDRREAAEKFKKLAALNANEIASVDELNVGDRVYSIIYGRYVEVVKINRKSVRVRDEAGDTYPMDVRTLQRRSYNDCVQAVA
jgi:hypothetical protein